MNKETKEMLQDYVGARVNFMLDSITYDLEEMVQGNYLDENGNVTKEFATMLKFAFKHAAFMLVERL